MSIENGKCPGCGQAMSLDDSKEKMTCKYCGSEVIIPQAIQKCRIDGITTFDALILAADQAIKYDTDYDKALKKYKQALDLRPDDSRVFWGIFLCEMDSIAWYRRTKGFVQYPNDIPNCIQTAINKWGQRAYDTAPEATKPYYWQKLQEAKQLYQAVTTPEKKKGCYIATAVYGSYDCPEVWTLRRYRDYNLDESILGKLFIKIYYALSPTVIRLFGKTKRFNDFWRKQLDKKVARLQSKGVAYAPYDDKY
jgi:tetratricopeptide (TPR) repeat protein